jgi:hypothetical protein
MKKKYIKPTTFVAEIKQRCSILNASKVETLTNNTDLNLFGEGDVPGRSREAFFDDGEWFEE